MRINKIFKINVSTARQMTERLFAANAGTDDILVCAINTINASDDAYELSQHKPLH